MISCTLLKFFVTILYSPYIYMSYGIVRVRTSLLQMYMVCSVNFLFVQVMSIAYMLGCLLQI